MSEEEAQQLPLHEEVIALRRRVAELEQRETEGTFRALLDAAPDAIVIADHEGSITLVNAQTEKLFGYSREELLGQPLEILMPERFRQKHIGYQARYYHNPRPRPMGSNISLHGQRKDGSEFAVEISLSPLKTETSALVISIIRDLTERQRVEEALRQSAVQEETIRMQELLLRQLSTPLIPINQHVMIMPLVGTVDSRRAQQVIETLLEGIARSSARVAILDITGVALVDTQVADALLRAARAVQLLGAQVVLTGIRPEVAQTLVGLGAELRGIVTCGSLQSGISYAMNAG